MLRPCSLRCGVANACAHGLQAVGVVDTGGHIVAISNLLRSLSATYATVVQYEVVLQLPKEAGTAHTRLKMRRLLTHAAHHPLKEPAPARYECDPALHACVMRPGSMHSSERTLHASCAPAPASQRPSERAGASVRPCVAWVAGGAGGRCGMRASR